MVSYRLYRLTIDGHIRSGEDFQAKDDTEAERLARDAAQGYAVEIWRLDRLVKQLPAPSDL